MGGVFWFVYTLIQREALTLDAPIKEAFAYASGALTYSQQVETTAYFPERKLFIFGTYDVDTPQRKFAAYSTSTLSILHDPVAHTFTHTNISIEDTIYVKVETEDPLLQKTVQTDPGWQRVHKDAIPEKLASIAVWGPIQDNLKILSENGAYITLTKKWGEYTVGGELLRRYSFKVSGKTPESKTEALSALLDRIGKDGVIDIWIDARSAVRMLTFQNPSYVSTTTLSKVNQPLTIEAPVVQ